MRGPDHKIKLDVRRTWKCPACGRERKQPGDVTTVTCSCRTPAPFMVIATERTVTPRPYQPLSQEDVRSSTFGIDDMPVLQPHPNSLPPEPTSPRRPRPGSDNAASKSIPNTVEAPPNQEASPTGSDQAVPETPLPKAPLKSESPPEDDWGEGIL